jgi:RNA polymerase sigma-70 factor (sigma-E family)
MGTLGGIVDAGTPEGRGAASSDPLEPPVPPAGFADGEAHPDASDSGPGPKSETFAEFYAGHFTELVRLAVLLSGSTDTAPDLVQDCFVRLHGRWSSVRLPLPYVRRSVVHACASHHRRVARARRQPAPEAQVSVLDADELGDALAKLPARQRAAVVLRYYADLPDADIAVALRCRPGTVRSLIHRALTDLRGSIEP